MKFVESRDIDIFINLYSKTFKRHGILVAEENLLKIRAIVESALQSEYGNIFLCTDENNIAVSASVFLFDENYAYYL